MVGLFIYQSCTRTWMSLFSFESVRINLQTWTSFMSTNGLVLIEWRIELTDFYIKLAIMIILIRVLIMRTASHYIYNWCAKLKVWGIQAPLKIQTYFDLDSNLTENRPRIPPPKIIKLYIISQYTHLFPSLSQKHFMIWTNIYWGEMTWCESSSFL